MACQANSIQNSDGTCTCLPGFIPQGGQCVPFDYTTASNTDTNKGNKWKDALNTYGPLVLGGIGSWWGAKNTQKQQTNTGTMPPPAADTKKSVPVWVWIAGAVVVVVVAVALIRRKAA